MDSKRRGNSFGSNVGSKISSNRKLGTKLAPNKNPIHISTPHEHPNPSKYFLTISF